MQFDYALFCADRKVTPVSFEAYLDTDDFESPFFDQTP